MKQTTSMMGADGTVYDIPDDEMEAFKADFGDSVRPVQNFRAEGTDYTIPDDEAEAFKADFPNAERTRRISFADGSSKDMTVGEMADFLRSDEYRNGERYAADREAARAEAENKARVANAGNEPGSPFVAGLKETGRRMFTAEGIRESAEESAIAKPYAYANDLANSLVKGLLGGSAKITEGVGTITGIDAVRDAGRADQQMLERNLPTDMLNTSGGGVVNKVLQTGKGVASVTGEFAPAAIPGVGQAYAASVVGAGAANRADAVYDEAVANGASVAEATSLAMGAGAVDALGNMLLMGKFKGIWGGAQKGAADAVKQGVVRKLLGETARTGAIMGGQAGAGNAIDQMAKAQDFSAGEMAEAALDGFIEGGMFHLVNTGMHAAVRPDWQTKPKGMPDGMARDVLDTAEGRALVASNSPEAAKRMIEVREKGGDVSRKMLRDMGVPDSVAPTVADRNALGDSIVADFKAYREAVTQIKRTKLDGQQYQALSDEVAKQVGTDQSEDYGKVVIDVLGEIKDAKELDDPYRREELVGKAVERLYADENARAEADAAAKRAEREARKDDAAAALKKNGKAVPEDKILKPEDVEANKETREEKPDETGNGAAEEPAKPEQGVERPEGKPEAPRPLAGAEKGTEAPREGVVGDNPKEVARIKEADTRSLILEDARTTDGETQGLIEEELLSRGYVYGKVKMPNGTTRYRWHPKSAETPENKPQTAEINKKSVYSGEEAAKTEPKAEEVRDSMRGDPVLQRIDAEFKKAKTDEERNALKEQFAARVAELRKKGKKVPKGAEPTAEEAAEVKAAEAEPPKEEAPKADEIEKMTDEELKKRIEDVFNNSEDMEPDEFKRAIKPYRDEQNRRKEASKTDADRQKESLDRAFGDFTDENGKPKTITQLIDNGWRFEKKKVGAAHRYRLVKDGVDAYHDLSSKKVRSLMRPGNYDLNIKAIEEYSNSVHKIDAAENAPASAPPKAETPTEAPEAKKTGDTAKPAAKKPKPVKADAKKAAKVVENFVSKDGTRKALSQVHHDHEGGVVVASDGRVLIATKHGYDKNAKDDPDNPYPNWRQVVPNYDGKTAKVTERTIDSKGESSIETVEKPVQRIEINPTEVSDICKKVIRLHKATDNKNVPLVSIPLADGEQLTMDASYLKKVADAMAANGITEIRAISGKNPLLAKNADTTIVASPLRVDGQSVKMPDKVERAGDGGVKLNALTGRVIFAPERSDTGMNSRKWADELKRQIASGKKDATDKARKTALYKAITDAWKNGEKDPRKIYDGYAGEGEFDKLKNASDRELFVELLKLGDKDALAERLAEYEADHFPQFNRWRKDLPREVEKIEKRIAAEDEIDALMDGAEQKDGAAKKGGNQPVQLSLNPDYSPLKPEAKGAKAGAKKAQEGKNAKFGWEMGADAEPTGKAEAKETPKSPEQEIEERLDLRRLDPKRRSDPKVLEWAKKQGRTVTDGMVTPDAVRAYDEAMTEAAAKVVNKRWFPDMKIVAHKYGETIKRGQHVLEQIGSIYTGSAADYDKPSLHAVGTGEGAQVYGWGLYGSNRRGVARTYAQSDAGRKGNGKLPFLRGIDGAGTKKDGVLMEKPRKENYNLDLQYWADMIAWESPNERIALQSAKKYGEAVESYLKAYIKDYEFANDVPSEYLYEQTFFTNRAPGDESHLLKWYEPVSEEQLGWIESRLKAEGIGNVNMPFLKGELPNPDNPSGGPANAQIKNGRTVYDHLANKLGSPQAASEFLARAGIDGVKYPVGTAGGKVKDGNKVGWNYVSFRDDNIRVDHKWRDGELQYLRDTAGRTLGWFDPKAKEVHLLPGADPQTVAHEIMWHGTRQYMTERAAKGDARAQKFLDMMKDVEKNAPQDIKDIVNRLYARGGVAVNADTLLNEYGAWFTMKRGGYELDKAMQKAENRNWFAKGLHSVKEMFKDFLVRHGGNRVDISKVDGMTRDEFVDFLAEQFASGKTLGNIKEEKPAVSTNETLFQKWRRKTYDQNAAVRDLERDIEKKKGVKIAADDSVEAANALKYGLKEAANMDIQGRMRTLREKLHEGGIHFADLEYYAACKAAAGRDAKIDKRNLDKLEADMKAEGATPDEIDAAKAAYRSSNGSHIDPREARRVIAEIEGSSKAQAYKDALAELRKTIDETLQTQVDAGLVSKESAAQWRAEEPDYVPFKNEYDQDNGGWNGRGSSMSNFVNPEHRMAKGRQSAAGDIIAHVFMDHQAARHRAIENAVRQKLAKLVRENPELGEVEKLKPDAVKNIEQSDPNVVIFKQNGDSYAIRLDGTRGAAVANAFTGRETLDMKWADKGFSVFGKKISFRNFTRWSAGMATRYSPTFAVRNTLKDNIELANIVYSERGPLAGSAWMGKYVANRAKMATTLAKYVTTGKIDASTAEGNILDRYIKAGGMIAGGTRSEAFSSIKDRLDPKAIEKEMKRGKSKVAAAARHTLNSIAYLNEYAEMATRLGAFATEVQGGKSDADAALFSRRATVDFNRHGDWTPGFNVMRMFSNSTLGATARAAAALGKSKYGMVATGMLFANGLTQALIEHFTNADEDKERAKRGEATGKDVGEFDRRTSLFYFRNGDKLYKVAQHESPFSLINYAGNCVGRWLCGELSGKDMAKNLGVNAAEIAYNLLPMGSINLTSRGGNVTEDFKAAIVSGIVPSVLQPIAEIAFDMDFKGDSVTKKMFDDFASRSHNGKAHTPDWAKATAEWIQEHTGGNAGNHKGLDVAPEVVQKLVEGYGKNLLKDVSTAFSTGEAVIKGEWRNLDPRNTPIKRDFVRPLDGNTGRYYSAMDDYKGDRKEFLAMVSRWTPEERKAFVKEHPWAANPDANKTITRIQELQKLQDGMVKTGKRGQWRERKTPVTDEQKKRWKAMQLELQAKFLKYAERRGGEH